MYLCLSGGAVFCKIKCMNELVLIKPSKELQDKIWQYRSEYLSFGETYINGSCNLAGYDNFDKWLNFILALEKTPPKGFVKSSTYLSVRKSDGKIIGTIQLRHRLNKELKNRGGNIGYGICPSERKKGYGKEQLLLVLEQAKKLKMTQVIISCNKDNEASAHTAVSCGAFLKGESFYEDEVFLMFCVKL